MNAESFIDSICESPKDTIFAYVPRMTSQYGTGVPPKAGEDPFVSWIKHFLKGEGNRLPREYARDALARPDEFIDLLITKFDAIFVMVLNGNVDVYSFRQVAKNVPKGFLDKVQDYVDVTPETPVGWFQSVNANPVATVAAEPVFGMEPQDVAVEVKRSAAMQRLSPKPGVSPAAKKELRRKFWGPGGFDPSTAPDIVDKLLQ